MSLLSLYKTLKPSSNAADVLNVLHDIGDAFPSQITPEDTRSLVALLLDDLHLTVVSNESGRLSTILSGDAYPALHALKSLGRTDEGARLVSQKSNLNRLRAIYAQLKGVQDKAADEALRCVANTLTLVDDSRDTWAEVGGADDCLALLETSNPCNFLFLAARILMFVCASEESPFLPSLFATMHPESSKSGTGTSIIGTVVSRMKYAFEAVLADTPMSQDALTWLLKFTSILIHHWPSKHLDLDGNNEYHGQPINEVWSTDLDPIVPLAIQIFLGLPPTLPSPLREPLTIAIQVLTLSPINHRLYGDILPPSSLQSPSQSASDIPRVAVYALDVFESALEYYFPGSRSPDDDETLESSIDESNFEGSLSPLALYLVRLCLADTTHSIRLFTRNHIIPPNLDRTKPLPAQSNTLGKCIRLMGSIRFELLKKSVGELLYVLCDSNAQTMSLQIGYGNAAGFLYTRGVFAPPTPLPPLPDSESTSSSISTDVDQPTTPDPSTINPISGMLASQDAEARAKIEAELAQMTEEEKEREAEKLFVLFDRMEKAGISENPMRRAVREGKMEKYAEEAERRKAKLEDSD